MISALQLYINFPLATNKSKASGLSTFAPNKSLINQTFTACFISNLYQNSKIKSIGHRINQGIIAGQSYEGFDRKSSSFHDLMYFPMWM